MEQGSSNGSRSSGDYPAGASASTSAEGNGGDSSVDKVTKSNQDEEEDGRSAYGSEDFDDQSKCSAAESEVGAGRVDAVRSCLPTDAAVRLHSCYFPAFSKQDLHALKFATHKTTGWSTTD